MTFNFDEFRWFTAGGFGANGLVVTYEKLCCMVPGLMGALRYGL